MMNFPNGLYKFRADTGEDRVVEDCISSLTEGGADLLWIETATPNVSKIAAMVNRVKEAVPNAKLTYNNSPSFNWTLNLRKQVREDWIAAGTIETEAYPDDRKQVREDWIAAGTIETDAYPDDNRLMSAKYDDD